MNVRILLADDHQILMEGLKELIEEQKGMQVIAEAPDGPTALELVQKHKPDIAIIDILMPGINGIEVARKISREWPDIKILCLSMYTDRRFVLEMFRAGASGYVAKESAFDELMSAIRAIMCGRIYISPRVAECVIESIRKGGKPCEESAYTKLTDREREILKQIAEGMSTKEIASALHISLKTVETHRKQIMEKTGMNSIAELTKYAIQEGITSLYS